MYCPECKIILNDESAALSSGGTIQEGTAKAIEKLLRHPRWSKTVEPYLGDFGALDVAFINGVMEGRDRSRLDADYWRGVQEVLERMKMGPHQS